MKFSRRLAASAVVIGVVAAGAWALSHRKAPLDPVLKSGPLLLNKRAILTHETFWDDRDWAWYEANIPFLDTPDEAINTTYLYRWELLTKHLVYASPQTGYVFTEFIDRPDWSGRYGAISCPAGHQLQEARWLKTTRIARDYARYWTQTPGAQPLRYSNWLADATWQTYQVQGDEKWLLPLRAGLEENFAGWQREHFRSDAGMFWQTGHDDGMELNINSRQTLDAMRGAPGYRPTLNSYLFADARALAKMARLENDEKKARFYDEFSMRLKEKVQQQLWDNQRQFFFHQFRDTEIDGLTPHKAPIAARSLTYQSGPLAGSDEGRELMGYVPWQFELPDKNRGYEVAWKFLNAPQYFKANYGPSFVARHDPLFEISDSCCWWSGQSWPYATAQTLTALANVLNDYPQNVVTREDYFQLLQTYTQTHRKNGQPYLAEAANPDTGSWQGYDNPQHSEHYFHSGYNDQIITGLIGLRPRDDDTIELNPLAPLSWKYFALDDVLYRGHKISLFWDADGTRYRRGRGLQIWIDGKRAAQRDNIGLLKVVLTPRIEKLDRAEKRLVNYAVNNDFAEYPQISASLSGPQVLAGLKNVVDGVHFYSMRPHNRWTFETSKNQSDWIAIDFGTSRTVSRALLYWLDDGANAPVRAPKSVELQWWDGQSWRVVEQQKRNFTAPVGHRANRIEFAPLKTSKMRVQIEHQPGATSGLTEIELWGA